MATINIAKLKYFAIGVITLLGAYFFFFSTRPGCRFKVANRFSLVTVTYGPFTEFIPQTGTMEFDSDTRCHNLKVMVDERYLSRIAVGLKATTTFNNAGYVLTITNVTPAVIDGRFNIELNFCDKIPPGIADGNSLRLRIELNEPSNEILLPVGGFYKDTGGKWIFIVKNGTTAVRRDIKLGRKSGSEYFEVLEGLRPGDQVITSSYKELNDLDSVDVLELKTL